MLSPTWVQEQIELSEQSEQRRTREQDKRAWTHDPKSVTPPGKTPKAALIRRMIEALKQK